MTPRRLHGDLLFLGGLLAVVAIPIVAASVALRQPVWSPVLDLAMTEVRTGLRAA